MSSTTAKRPAPASNTSDAGDAAAQAKRRRVSRACDTCRSAKDKCDGVKPRCQRCVSMQRQCTYLNPEKRRGIRTGYLRAIEEDGGGRDGFLDKDSPASEALLKRWHQSEVYQGIDRLISRDESTPRSDGADGDNRPSSAPRLLDSNGRRATDFGSDLAKWRSSSLQLASPVAQRGGFGDIQHLELPAKSKQYLDDYFTWAHCWFPIVEREPLAQVAASYPATGFRINPRDRSYSRHAELWSAMAVGAALESRRGKSSPTNANANAATTGAADLALREAACKCRARRLPT
ncbi:unnamed protein product [Parascedosporium putredinis]|uniref:Zn(2)-C6 fungal-type domain-containing protein n=1 Tax=Parascedosporium putredinis TaxID=1442378 RepID=A0A9P1M876_9PEZI|nr:unnamed protein product [Parascedosporium putredinis]CAI7989600.1 unnamed protein product [Parascedosporium putredinis]